MDMKWYIINCSVGQENTAKLAIEKRIESENMAELFGEILIPSESVVELVKGKKKSREKKFFPGYMFIKMAMTDPAWHLVRGSTKVTGFVSSGSRPSPVSEEEVQKVTRQMEVGAEKPKHKITFTVGESVNVIDGPFNNFSGAVEEINEEKGRVKVLVSIFGRPTPVELDFVQVEKS